MQNNQPSNPDAYEQWQEDQNSKAQREHDAETSTPEGALAHIERLLSQAFPEDIYRDSLRRIREALPALLVLVAMAGSVAYAGPVPYTIDTKTGLTRTAERNLYDAVRGMVAPVARWLGLTPAEEECANAMSAQALIKATKEASGHSLWGFPGSDEAMKMFEKSQDDWCNKAGGMRGAREIAPYAERAKSFMRPFLREQLEEARAAQARPLTAAEVAAIIAAGLLALPVLAPL